MDQALDPNNSDFPFKLIKGFINPFANNFDNLPAIKKRLSESPPGKYGANWFVTSG